MDEDILTENREWEMNGVTEKKGGVWAATAALAQNIGSLRVSAHYCFSS